MFFAQTVLTHVSDAVPRLHAVRAIVILFSRVVLYCATSASSEPSRVAYARSRSSENSLRNSAVYVSQPVASVAHSAKKRSKSESD